MRKMRSAGFSLVEMVVVIGIIMTFLGLITVNLASQQRRVNLSTAVETFLTDLRFQQLKAMVGDKETGMTATDYGIYLSSSSYTLFRGSSYVAADPDNLEIPLGQGLQFANSGKTIIFSRFTGEISGYNPVQNTIVLEDGNNNLTRTITFNAYGVPILLTK
jgi:type II secretory pathway pseudopilin PulG